MEEKMMRDAISLGTGFILLLSDRNENISYWRLRFYRKQLH